MLVTGTEPSSNPKRRSVLRNVAGYIIICEFCERIAYYGFAGSLILFFQNKLNMSNSEADVQYSAWAGACYVTPLLGGLIADKYLGRYWTILIFCLIYVFGLALVVVFSSPRSINKEMFFIAMYIIALGTGGIKPNVSTMGAEQFDENCPEDLVEKESYFNWFYWAINLGAFIAYTTVSYICQYGIPQLGGEDWGFFVGYMIPMITMALAILVFYAGTSKYKRTEPQGSTIEKFVNVCVEAFWTRRHTKRADLATIHETDWNPLQTSLMNRDSTGRENGLELSSPKNSKESSNALRAAAGIKANQRSLDYLDKASMLYGGSYQKSEVDSVKLVIRLFPFLGILIVYWGIYNQMTTAFQNQGCQMDLSIGSFMVPVSALNIFDTLAILVLVPLFDAYVYPAVKKRGYSCSMLTKIGWGLIFALLSMILAGLIEVYRKENARAAGNYYDVNARDNISPCQNIDDYNPYQYQSWFAGNVDSEPVHCSQISGCINTTSTGLLSTSCISCDDIPQSSTISVFWQIPQFVLVGVSEILASITALEFFYSQAPLAMRSVTSSLNLFMNALGSWITIPLLMIVNSDPNNEWVPTNIDQGHLEWYFFLLATLMAVNQVLFIKVSDGYQYVTHDELVAAT